jgi:hypothetical protein
MAIWKCAALPQDRARELGGGGASGAILTVLAGVVKNMMASK